MSDSTTTLPDSGTAITRWMTNAIPDDDELLAAMGRITIRHQQLDYMLRMTIKMLTDVSVKVALDATQRHGSAELRKRVNKLARVRLGEGKPLLQLQALLERCRRASRKRNRLVHAMWAGVTDSDTYFIQTEDHQWEALPSAEQLEELSLELIELAIELNDARRDGFLHKALHPDKG